MLTTIDRPLTKRIEKVIYKPLLSSTESNQGQEIQILDSDVEIDGLFTVLTQKGMDRLTDSRIEHVICTSALAAFY